MTFTNNEKDARWISTALSAFVVVLGVVFKTVRTLGIQAQRSIQKVGAIGAFRTAGSR